MSCYLPCLLLVTSLSIDVIPCGLVVEGSGEALCYTVYCVVTLGCADSRFFAFDFE